MPKEEAIQLLRDLFYAGLERQSIQPTKAHIIALEMAIRELEGAVG